MQKFPGLILALLILQAVAFSQPDGLKNQINQQVWKPFLKAFNSFDTEAFMAVHSRELSRVNQDGNLVYGYDKYYHEIKQGNENAKKENQKRTLELRFIQRIAAADKAFEVGYYKFTSFQPDGTTQNGYGKFHVLLRKEKGSWKILMDADASGKTDEGVFMSAKPLE